MINLVSLNLVLISAFLTAIAALLVKKGMNQFVLEKILTNGRLILGITIYILAAGIYIAALPGEQLSVLFPLGSTVYLWSQLFSVKFLNEKMTFWKWLSMIGIITGVLFIGFGS